MTRCTARGHAPENPENAPVPTDRKLSDGQHADHWVLCEAERAKGFVRPVRLSYRHVGPLGPEFPLRDLSPEEQRRFGRYNYMKFEAYPQERLPSTGRFWTQEKLDKIGKGCGAVTSMPQSIAETYARSPGYYGNTFCCHCGGYSPVGADGEFVWDGTDIRVGT
jgi:hypothetical protein